MAAIEGPLAPHITCEAQILDFDTHPTEALIASGLVNGKCVVHAAGMVAAHGQAVGEMSHHQGGSCRCVKFSKDGGKRLYTASSDLSWQLWMRRRGRSAGIQRAHKQPVNCIVELADFVIAAGDDSGIINLDVQQADPIMRLTENGDYADMLPTRILRGY